MDLLFVFIMVAGVIGAAVVTNRRIRAAWTAAARMLGLDYRGSAFSTPKLTGTIDGIDVTVQGAERGSAKGTRFLLTYPPLPIALKLTRRSGLARFAEALGLSDVQTGDDQFDAAFTIQTSDPDQLPIVLDTDTRNLLRSLITSMPTLTVTDTQITFRRNNLERKPDRIIRTVRELVALANSLQRSTGEHPARDSRVESIRLESRMHDVTADPWNLPPPAPMAPPTMPDQIPAPPSTEMFTIPEMDEDVLGSMGAGTDTADSSMADSSLAEAPPTVESDAIEVARAFFGGSLLSFQATELFEKEYAGRPVRWEGTVVDRGVVEVGTLDTNLFGPLPIRVHVTGGKAVAGADVVVEGTLAGMNPFERTIAVDGTIRPR